MATTYCNYYGSVGATGYQTYHGCVTAPPIDPADISGTCSILPEQCGEIRFDQGATWWCDYRWCVGDQTIPLNDYKITAVIFNPDGSRFATLTEGNGLAKNSETFRVKLTAKQTDSIKFSGRSLPLTIDLDLERVTGVCPVTGYGPTDVARPCAGLVTAYRRGSGVGESAPVLPGANEDLQRICESIKVLEDLIDSGAKSVVQDGQSVSFDRADVRKRLRQLLERKAILEAAATGAPRPRKRRPIINRINLSDCY